MSQFERDKDHLVKREENRNLHQDRQAASGGVNFFSLVKLHHVALQLLTVIACIFLELLHLGLKLFHLGHGHIGFIRQREQQRLDQQGQSDDRDAHVTDKDIQMMQYPEDRFCQEKEPAPIDGIDKLVDALSLVFTQGFPLFGTGEQLG